MAILTSGRLLFSFVTLATEISNLPSKVPVQPAGAAPVGVNDSVTPCGMAMARPMSAETRAREDCIVDTTAVKNEGTVGLESAMDNKEKGKSGYSER